MGYAFINLIDKNDIILFYKSYHMQKWPLFKSGKVIFLFRFARLNMLE